MTQTQTSKGTQHVVPGMTLRPGTRVWESRFGGLSFIIENTDGDDYTVTDHHGDRFIVPPTMSLYLSDGTPV